MTTIIVPETLERDRLLALADFLDTVPAANFDLQSYQSDDGTPEYVERLKAHTCGTTACAVGYLPLVDPENWQYRGRNSMPESEKYLCEEDYFGFEDLDGLWRYLFAGDGPTYSTPAHVSARIRDLCARPNGSEFEWRPVEC